MITSAESVAVGTTAVVLVDIGVLPGVVVVFVGIGVLIGAAIVLVGSGVFVGTVVAFRSLR